MTDRERRELVNDIQAAVQQTSDNTWIMESPDGGKTVSKRRFGEKEKFYLSNVNGKWYNYTEALDAIRQQDHEAELREQHPSLNDAWLVYQALLGMVDSDIPDDNNDKA